MKGRNLKSTVYNLLQGDNYTSSLNKILVLPGRRVVNPLFSFFYNGKDLIRWRAVTAMGAVIANLAQSDMESARVVMRRLMWNLNDESGGIGWGSPEAMGETMARNEQMAKEYSGILKSYLNPGGNYLEHGLLQRGVLWAMGRLAQVRPSLVKNGAPFVFPFLQSQDFYHRGLAVWALNFMGIGIPQSDRIFLLKDNSKLVIYSDWNLSEYHLRKIVQDNRFEHLLS